MRPIYLHISYIAKDNNENVTYGSGLFNLVEPKTITEIREMIYNWLIETHGEKSYDLNSVQIMSVSVLKKRVYKMLKEKSDNESKVQENE